MRYTQKRNGKNVIPMLNAVCGLDMPYWRIDRADDLHSYLSGDAADKLAAYEDAEEQGRMVIPRWIPVTERLPEEKEEVLISDDSFFGGLIVAVAFLDRGKWEWRDDMCTSASPHPTHWMPMPQLPRKE